MQRQLGPPRDLTSDGDGGDDDNNHHDDDDHGDVDDDVKAPLPDCQYGWGQCQEQSPQPCLNSEKQRIMCDHFIELFNYLILIERGIWPRE